VRGRRSSVEEVSPAGVVKLAPVGAKCREGLHLWCRGTAGRYGKQACSCGCHSGGLRSTGSGVSARRASVAVHELVHLHGDDYPQTLALFHALFAGRLDEVAGVGFSCSETGAWVDWDRLLAGSWLSSSEIAAVYIARGCALAERHGGLGAMSGVVVEIVSTVCTGSPRCVGEAAGGDRRMVVVDGEGQ
jgi:hypothetical protein